MRTSTRGFGRITPLDARPPSVLPPSREATNPAPG